MTTHSKIGASSMYRWSSCPGSVRLSAGIESKSSKYAEEGTKAHDLAEKIIRAGLTKDYNVVDRLVKTADPEMAEHVQVYTSYVLHLASCGDQVLVEHQFDLSKIYAGCFGTADAVAWQPWTKKLIVADFKYGAGIAVEVENNPQLMYYALGALVTCGFPAETVEMVIIQPRCNHPDGPIRSQTIDAIDLLDFKVDLKQYAQATEDPNAPLVPGDHCHFCPAAQINPATAEPYCPTLVNSRKTAMQLEFKHGLPYDPVKLKLALDSREVVKAWLKALDEFAYAEAEAGRPPMGYKLVAKRATRKWRSEGEAIEKLQEMKVDRSAFMETSVKSPAQMEKLLGKGFIDSLVVAESSGHTLVPESDKRPPVKLSAKEEFSAVADG